jgi:acetyltransferase EpsM
VSPAEPSGRRPCSTRPDRGQEASTSAARGKGPRPGVCVIGAGDHAHVVSSVLEAAGIPIAGHYDDDQRAWGTSVGPARVLGPLSEIPSGAPAIIAIGDNDARKRIADTLDLDWITAIHPFSWLDPGVRPGPGTLVCPGAIVMVGARVGAHVILNNRASVGHDAVVEDFAHLTVAHLGGGARAGEGATLGLGSVVLSRRRVGAWATVGAGAVVTRDVRPGVVVIGIPARERPSLDGLHRERAGAAVGSDGATRR